jgi:hypothetical protein
MVTQEFVAGALTVALGCAALYLQQCEWYRNWVYSGYWKQYNTPSGRTIGNIQCVAVIIMGLAMCLGYIQFKD